MLFHNRIDIPELTPLLVVVETITDDKVVGNPEGDVVDIQFRLQLLGFEKQGTDMHRRWVSRTQRLDHTLHGLTAFHDVLHNHHRTTAQILIDTNHLLDLSR